MITAAKIPGRIRRIDAAIAEFGEADVDTYVQALNWSDPLADAFAADCTNIGHGKGMKMLTRLLAQEVTIDELSDAPDSLRNLMAHLEAVPDWVDLDQIDKGAAAYSRHAREAGIALGTASLVSGYNNAAAARPLVMTGRFLDDAKLRALETSMWVFAVARPGGLHRGGDGFARTARVRMIHAFVRQHILTKMEWDGDELGIPINQADLAYTVVEFSMLPIRSMQRLGVHYTRDELAAMYAMWRYMGYLIGVDDRVLVKDGPEATHFEDLHMMVSPPPDDDCRAFVAALFDNVLAVDMKETGGLLGLVGKHWGRALLHGLARDFVGDEIADSLAIDRNRWRYVPKLTTPVLNISSRAIALSPALQERQLRRNLAEVDRLLAETAASLGVKHDLVDQSASHSKGHPASQ